MTQKEALKIFREEILPHIPKHDYIMKREEWNNFTDFLCKNGQITLQQYESWDNPF